MKKATFMNLVTVAAYAMIAVYAVVALVTFFVWVTGGFKKYTEEAGGLKFNCMAVSIADNEGTAKVRVLSEHAVAKINQQTGEMQYTDPSQPIEIRLEVRDENGKRKNGIIDLPSKVMLGEEFEIKALTSEADGLNIGGDCFLYAFSNDDMLSASPLPVFVDVPIESATLLYYNVDVDPESCYKRVVSYTKTVTYTDENNEQKTKEQVVKTTLLYRTLTDYQNDTNAILPLNRKKIEQNNAEGQSTLSSRFLLSDEQEHFLGFDYDEDTLQCVKDDQFKLYVDVYPARAINPHSNSSIPSSVLLKNLDADAIYAVCQELVSRYEAAKDDEESLQSYLQLFSNTWSKLAINNYSNISSLITKTKIAQAVEQLSGLSVNAITTYFQNALGSTISFENKQITFNTPDYRVAEVNNSTNILSIKATPSADFVKDSSSLINVSVQKIYNGTLGNAKIYQTYTTLEEDVLSVEENESTSFEIVDIYFEGLELETGTMKDGVMQSAATKELVDSISQYLSAPLYVENNRLLVTAQKLTDEQKARLLSSTLQYTQEEINSAVNLGIVIKTSGNNPISNPNPLKSELKNLDLIQSTKQQGYGDLLSIQKDTTTLGDENVVWIIVPLRASVDGESFSLMVTLTQELSSIVEGDEQYLQESSQQNGNGQSQEQNNEQPSNDENNQNNDEEDISNSSQNAPGDGNNQFIIDEEEPNQDSDPDPNQNEDPNNNTDPSNENPSGEDPNTNPDIQGPTNQEDNQDLDPNQNENPQNNENDEEEITSVSKIVIIPVRDEAGNILYYKKIASLLGFGFNVEIRYADLQYESEVSTAITKYDFEKDKSTQYNAIDMNSLLKVEYDPTDYTYGTVVYVVVNDKGVVNSNNIVNVTSTTGESENPTYNGQLFINAISLDNGSVVIDSSNKYRFIQPTGAGTVSIIPVLIMTERSNGVDYPLKVVNNSFVRMTDEDMMSSKFVMDNDGTISTEGEGGFIVVKKFAPIVLTVKERVTELHYYLDENFTEEWDKNSTKYFATGADNKITVYVRANSRLALPGSDAEKTSEYTPKILDAKIYDETESMISGRNSVSISYYDEDEQGSSNQTNNTQNNETNDQTSDQSGDNQDEQNSNDSNESSATSEIQTTTTSWFFSKNKTNYMKFNLAVLPIKTYGTKTYSITWFTGTSIQPYQAAITGSTLTINAKDCINDGIMAFADADAKEVGEGQTIYKNYATTSYYAEFSKQTTPGVYNIILNGYGQPSYATTSEPVIQNMTSNSTQNQGSGSEDPNAQQQPEQQDPGEQNNNEQQNQQTTASGPKTTIELLNYEFISISKPTTTEQQGVVDWVYIQQEVFLSSQKTRVKYYWIKYENGTLSYDEEIGNSFSVYFTKPQDENSLILKEFLPNNVVGVRVCTAYDSQISENETMPENFDVNSIPKLNQYTFIYMSNTSSTVSFVNNAPAATFVDKQGDQSKFNLKLTFNSAPTITYNILSKNDENIVVTEKVVDIMPAYRLEIAQYSNANATGVVLVTGENSDVYMCLSGDFVKSDVLAETSIGFNLTLTVKINFESVSSNVQIIKTYTKTYNGNETYTPQQQANQGD